MDMLEMDMPEPEEPQKLDYFTQPKQDKPGPSRKVVGFLGFIIYGVIALFLWLWTAGISEEFVRRRSFVLAALLAVVGGVAVFSTWRSFAAFREFVR